MDLENQEGQDQSSSTDDVRFEIDGEEVGFKDLDPTVVQEWYSAHQNMDDFQRSNTQKAQEIAEQRKENDNYKASVQKQIENYNTMVNYLHANPELNQMINEYVSKHGQQPMAQQQGLAPEMEQRLGKFEEFMQSQQQRVEQDDMVKTRESAYGAMSKTFSDFDRAKFDEYFDKKTGDFDKMEDLYTVIEKARRYDEVQAAQTKRGAGLQQSENVYPRETPEVVTREGDEDPLDKVFDGLYKQYGVEG